MEKGEFFEGTEKLLEMWFDESSNSSRDLRVIERSEWDKLLNCVKCKIISKKSDADMDAYVLSESSMFVTKRRFILKTCGRTTLLKAIEPIIRLAKGCGFRRVVDIFYSRKNFFQPHQQELVYQKFDDEVEHLDRLFAMGAAYCLGRMNGDCWYLYTLRDSGVNMPDQTLELLMWDLDNRRTRCFFKDMCSTGSEASQMSGIADLVDGALIDDLLFDPCGYSMNGIISGGHYITIHVTPEDDCSYVSFETNLAKTSYHDMVHDIIKIFNPNKFLLTLFANQESIALTYASSPIHVAGYTRQELQCCLLKNYTLNYCQFVRPDV